MSKRKRKGGKQLENVGIAVLSGKKIARDRLHPLGYPIFVLFIVLIIHGFIDFLQGGR